MHIAIRYIRLIWQVARPRTLLVIWLHLVFAYELLASSLPDVWQGAVALLAIAAWYIHAVALNDLSDQEVDALNLVSIGEDDDRPLINGTASPQQTMFTSYVAALILIACCLAIAWWLGLIALLMLALNAIYSLPPVRISARGGLAQVLLPFGYVSFPAAVAVALIGNVTASFLLAMAGLYLLFMGRLFLKDIRDEIGDRETGKHTYLVRHGHVSTLVQAGIWSVAGMLLTLMGIWEDQPFMLVPLLIGCMAVILWNLRHCLLETKLTYKLLRIAIIGRTASTWLFCLVLTVTFRHYGLSTALQIVLLVAAVTMFGFGIVALFEELATIKRRQAIAQRQEA